MLRIQNVVVVRAVVPPGPLEYHYDVRHCCAHDEESSTDIGHGSGGKIALEPEEGCAIFHSSRFLAVFGNSVRGLYVPPTQEVKAKFRKNDDIPNAYSV